MTLEDFLRMPKGADPIAYQTAVEKINKLKKSIARLNNVIEAEIDAMDVLKDTDDSRYYKHESTFNKLYRQREELLTELDLLTQEISG